MQQRRFLKWAVVASSVVLVTGFICYQAGAFSWLTRSRTATATEEKAAEMFGSSKVKRIFGGSKSDILVPPNSPPSPSDGTTPPKGGTFILGTKSAPIFTPSTPKQPTPGEAEKGEPKGPTEKSAPPANQKSPEE